MTLRYEVQIQPLSAEEGGGYLASAPDLPGCVSDGETPEEALAQIQDAIEAWIEAARLSNIPVPSPRLAAAE